VAPDSVLSNRVESRRYALARGGFAPVEVFAGRGVNSGGTPFWWTTRCSDRAMYKAISRNSLCYYLFSCVKFIAPAPFLIIFCGHVDINTVQAHIAPNCVHDVVGNV